MNWNDAIKLVDPARKPGGRHTEPVTEGDLQSFVQLLDINYHGWSDEFSTRMLKHWVVSWICTDTRVGLAVYCLDGVPVAVSAQPARKSDETIEFTSRWAADRVREAVLSYVDSPEPTLADLAEEIPQEWFNNKVNGLSGFGR